ncbi:hypothetical protein Ciccas_012601 [Cichlidogyrus casuarinus]|uniref:Uncharacterized protein n=1 Tax=Cichlidogyrus casuarinus TaxID=1844966 RepID=A0ABD2PQY4_9PLAT
MSNFDSAMRAESISISSTFSIAKSDEQKATEHVSNLEVALKRAEIANKYRHAYWKYKVNYPKSHSSVKPNDNGLHPHSPDSPHISSSDSVSYAIQI